MPLKWSKEKNPYSFNYYAKLRLGANATPTHIVSQAKRLTQQLRSGDDLNCAGHDLDEHQIGEASSQLREPWAQAEELLLVHPLPGSDDRKKRKKLAEKLEAETEISSEPSPLKFPHPLAAFWFLPPLSPDVLIRPDFRSLGLSEPGSAEDRESDIVFDV